MIITTTGGQTIYDVAVTYLGSAGGAWIILKDNRDFFGSINDRIPAGTKLFIDTSAIVNQNAVDVFSNRNDRANSGDLAQGKSFDNSFDNSFL